MTLSAPELVAWQAFQSRQQQLHTDLIACEQAIIAAPHDLDPVVRTLTLLEQAQRYDLALGVIEHAERMHPADPRTIYARAEWAALHGDYDLAAALYRRIAATAPFLDPGAVKLAAMLLRIGAFDEASILLEAAGTLARRQPGLGPESQVESLVGDILLRTAQPLGFLHFLHRFKLTGAYYEIPNLAWWQGESLSGTHVLLTHQLGFGDQVLYLSIVPRLLDQGCAVSIVTSPELETLVRASLPRCRIIALRRPMVAGVAAPDELCTIAADLRPDFQALYIHLPLIAMTLGIQAASRFFSPYLRAPDDATAALASTIAEIRRVADGRAIIGIAWDCIQRHAVDIHGAPSARFAQIKSLPQALLTELVDDASVRERYHFVALHPQQHFDAATAGTQAELPRNLSLADARLKNFGCTAALIEACDLTISVDMSVANLAPLLGKNTWVMMYHAGEFRFGNSGSTSPWLPSVRVFRQPAPHAWHYVVQQIKIALFER